MPPKGAKPASQATSDLFAPLEEQAEYTRALYYGREGTGKTTAALRATDGGLVYLVSAEGGTKRDPLRKLGVDLSRIRVFRPEEGELIAVRDLENVHSHVLSKLQEQPGSIHAVVIDSLTEVQQQLLEQVVHKRVTKSLVEVDPDFIDRSDYGTTNNQLQKLMRRFRDLPCHLIVTALERDKEKEDEVGPALSPGLATAVLGYMDVVLRFGSADGSYRARAKGTKRIRAKDRFGALPEVIAEPSFPRIESFLTGEITDEDDQLQMEMREIAETATATKKNTKKEN